MQFILLLALLQGADPVERSVDPKTQVVILVNEDVPESVEVGEYYAKRRGIPAKQICRVKTATTETISWPDFRTQILEPLKEFLKKRPSVLYVIPVYGVPVKTSEENPKDDKRRDRDRTERIVTNRDYACIDREIELIRQDHEINGWIDSKTFKEDRHFSVLDKIFIVCRLDGPSPDKVKAMIGRCDSS